MKVSRSSEGDRKERAMRQVLLHKKHDAPWKMRVDLNS